MLKAKEVEAAKAKEKPYKLTDGGGLYMLVNQTGRYWRYDYRYMGKRKTLALGVYPEVTLKEAREAHFEAHKQLANNIDPGRFRRLTKEKRLSAAENSFEKLAMEFLSRRTDWSDGHKRTVQQRLNNDILPFIGNRPVAEIGPQEILAVCRKVEGRGAIESAHRIKTVISQIFRYGVAVGFVRSDPCRDLSGALTASKPEHMAAITEPVKIGQLLRA